MSVINNLIDQSVVYLSPVLLCVLGGIFAYKANVLNIALEGMMMAGAFVSLLIANVTGSVPMGYLSAIVVCLLLGLVFSLMGVVLKGNVIVIGLAINMLMLGVTSFLYKLMSNGQSYQQLEALPCPTSPPAASYCTSPSLRIFPSSVPFSVAIPLSPTSPTL